MCPRIRRCWVVRMGWREPWTPSDPAIAIADTARTPAMTGAITVLPNGLRTVRRGRGPAGRCPARVLRIRLWRGHRRVPAKATRAFRLHVRLRGRAPDRCYGTTWHLHYVARSVGA